MKNYPIYRARFIACFLVASLWALTFGAQTCWAAEAPASATSSEPTEQVLFVMDEDETGPAQITTQASDASTDRQSADNNNGAFATEPADNRNAASTPEAMAAQAAAPEGAATLQASPSNTMSTQAEQTQGNEGPLPNGDYLIRPFVAAQSVLDVAGGSKASGANVQLYSHNGTAAQKWLLTYDASNDYYTIASRTAGNVLDVSGGSTQSGANVQVWTPNNTNAQKWRIVRDGSGWRVISALSPSLVLDVSGANTGNGTNIQIYQANDTNAQRFDFIALQANSAIPTATIEEGAYVMTAGTGKVIDVSGGSRDSGANVQQYDLNWTYAQRFYLEPNNAGFYRIFNIGSGLALDVSGAGLFPGTNVQQYSWNDTPAQLWSLRDNADGTFTFISKCNGLALDISGASSANGANLQVYTPNGTKAQKFTLTSVDLISTGAVSLYSAGSITRVIDVNGASNKANAALQIYDANNSMAQRFTVIKSGANYTLRPLCSGLYVAASGSSVVQSPNPTTWGLTFAKSGARRGIVLSTSNQAMTAIGSGNSAALSLQAPSDSILQSFCPQAMALIADGVYTIASAKDGNVLDVAGGSWQNEANIQTYANNDSGAQAFAIESVGDDWYRIYNAATGKAVDVAGARNANGTNVQQYERNGTAAQLWKAELTNTGQFVFVNRATGKALNANSGNVDIWDKNGTPAQEWGLKASSFDYDRVLYNALGIVQGRSSGTSYYILVDRGNTRTIVFQGSKGNWTPVKNWTVTVGAPSSATPSGDYTVWGRGYSFDGALGGTPYTCYYWTNFLNNVYLFHSIPYHQGTWSVQDGRLGLQASHGCVRLATENAKWIYDNIPNGTNVCIYN